MPKWKSFGIRKGFPTWSRSFLKKCTVFTHHYEEKQEMAFPPLGYRSPLCEESHSVSDPLAFTLPIPSSIAQETEIAFIESRNYLISLACLYEMCLAHSDCRGQKSSKQSHCLSKKRPCKQEGTACSLSRLGPLAVLWVFLFFKPETVSANSWGIPKPYSSGGQASSDIISE